MECDKKLSARPLALALSLVLSATLGISLAACSGSSASTTAHTVTSPKAKPTPTGQPTSGAAAAAVVKSTWIEFFNGNIPISKRLVLLQNSEKFVSFVHSQEKTSFGSLVFQATATVSAVTLQSALAQATVTYTILLAGKPLEKNLKGTAIYSDGKWLVADGTFCGLITLAYGAKSKLIPAACGT
jgi:hypothetical protein